MNIQEYISSGIVESYVLGLASPDERAEFEQLCAAHAEVRKAREQFELALEEYAKLNALPPAKNIRSKIFAEIEIENEKANPPVEKTDTDPALEQKEVPLIPRVTWQRYVTAAAIALLLLSTGLNFYLFNQYRKSTNRYEALLTQQSDLARTNNNMRARLDVYENSLVMLKDPDMTIIKMPAANVPTSPDSTSVATVYWNTRSKDVYLMVNNLPQPASDKQYQLWAIVDGQPVDAGVFDLQNLPGVLRMKNMPRAQMFAITLEKRGGSPTPQGPMYVSGKAS